ncbi:LysE family translocator [Rhodovibrio salinarum]|uniref:LysE family translocator n=1 Tax=Rhodovibrio salinarum TaxID=1087 RepID=A0A934UZH2_9PROT|nr:LysE family translocator [Rhodovibrio salinarum]MBK1696400.1 LysE family translocator [Rhodovibrio salinarum]
MISKLVFLLLAAFSLMGSPGPATLSLASLGAAFGFRSCRGYLLGIIAGTTTVLLIVATGVTAIVTAEPVMLLGLQIAAAVYIVYLAWKIATAPVRSSVDNAEVRPNAVVASFLPGLGLAIANPKAFAAIGAVYSGHSIVPSQPGLDAVVKVIALTGVIVIVNTAWLLFGSTFSRVLTNPVLGRAINIVFAVLLLGSVGMSLLMTWN